MKISYHKRYAPNGIVYGQTISMTKGMFDLLYKKVSIEIKENYPQKSSYSNECTNYLKPLVLSNNSICFMNLTTTRFINLYLNLKLKSRNTCIIIKG